MSLFTMHGEMRRYCYSVVKMRRENYARRIDLRQTSSRDLSSISLRLKCLVVDRVYLIARETMSVPEMSAFFVKL